MAPFALKPLARMALRNVRKNWRHSLGAVLSIVVGFIAMGLFTGYLDDLERTQLTSFVHRNMLGDVMVQREGASTPEGRQEPLRHALGPAEQSFLEEYLGAKGPRVETRARLLHLTGLASTGRSGSAFLAYGYDVEEGARLRGNWAWNVRAGRPLQEVGPDSVVLAKGLGAVLDCEPTSEAKVFGPDGAPLPEVRPFACRRGRVQLSATTESGQLNVVRPEVVGLLDAGLKELDVRLLMLPLPLAQRLLDTQAVSLYSIRLAPGEDARAFAQGLSAAARERGLAIEAVPWREHSLAELFRRGMELLGVYRAFVVLVVVAIAGMSVLTTMMKSVGERIREIGTLRSLGFLRRHVLVLFALEAGMLTLLSSGVGLAATLGLTWLINRSGVTYKAGVLSESVQLSVAVVPGAYAFAAAFLSLVAMAAALLAARRASRMGIPDALGHA